VKRLVFCFDGTSNVIEAVHPTNVVNIASSIADKDRKGRQQIVYYDEGVGSTQEDKISGGAFGAGLHRNILEAYKFLILNYQPDDEIFIFGFSRGAFTARSFAGLMHFAGIMQKYIGVWDTVKTLGWRKTAKEHAYHSHELNRSIESGRHAVSLDERREKFNVTLWRDVDMRNQSAGFRSNDPKRPFQQIWFPGVHGGTGGKSRAGFRNI